MPKNNRFTTICIIYLTAMLLLVGLRLAVGFGCFDQMPDEASEIVLNGLLPQIIIMFGVPLIMLLASQKINGQPVSLSQINHEVGWRKISLKTIALLVVLGVCLYLLNIFVSSFFASILQAFGYKFTDSPNTFHGVGGLVISLVLSAVLPGFCEEFLHRGVLLNGMVKQFGVRKALIMVSLLFGLMHMSIRQFFYASVLGWFMGVAVLATGSLWSSMIIHFINNGIAVYMSYAGPDELNLPGIDFLNNLFSNPVLSILTLILVIVLIGEIMRGLARHKFEQHLDSYTVRYLAVQNQFNTGDFDKVKMALPKIIKTMPTWKATMAYIETFDVPRRTKPLGLTLLTALFVMGSIITTFTFMWGTW